MRLENKVVLITASTKGIGLACVKACAKEGAIVYMAARNLENASKKDLDFSHTDIADYLDIVTMNLRSVFMASQAAAKHMARYGGGSIVNISSIGGLVPDISQVAYGSSKAAINHLTKLIAVQEAKNNIRCNAVMPGMTATQSVEKHLSEEFRSLFLRHIPLNKMGVPNEIASAVVYFAGDESAYTTGQILAVSGGFGLATPIYGDITHTNTSRT